MKIGDSARLVVGGYSCFGVVRALSPRRVWVWFGETGFGQRRWPFDRKGRPVGDTAVMLPHARLDVDYVSPFN
jgi:hypothetical protein